MSTHSVHRPTPLTPSAGGVPRPYDRPSALRDLPDDGESLLQLACAAPVTQRLYGNATDHLATILRPHWHKLRAAAPIIPAAAIAALRQALAEVARGNGQILHIGHCVEVLAEGHPEACAQRVAAFSALRDQMEGQLGQPVVTIARMVGQYAKPRSQFYEQTHWGSLPSFMGEMINGRDATPWSRQPDLGRLHWVQDASRIAARALSEELPSGRSPLWSSHEAYNLVYDGAQTLGDGTTVVNHSCHLPWIGVRSHYVDSPYIRYVGMIDNPVGAKVGPQTTPEALEQMVQAANPRHQPGKVILISRFGAGGAHEYLPPLLDTLQRMGASEDVLWIIDPMHGNTHKNRHGLKVRAVADMAAEIDETLALHSAAGSKVHGLHLESHPIPGSSVYECCPTRNDLDDVKPGPRYASLCDPRLNHDQTLSLITHYLKARRGV